MNTFVRDAEELLAVATAGGALQPADLVVAFDVNNSITVRDASGWQLPAISAELGATRIYRVTRDARKVRVEGRCGSLVCTLEVQRNQPVNMPVVSGALVPRTCLRVLGLGEAKPIPNGHAGRL